MGRAQSQALTPLQDQFAAIFGNRRGPVSPDGESAPASLGRRPATKPRPQSDTSIFRTRGKRELARPAQLIQRALDKHVSQTSLTMLAPGKKCLDEATDILEQSNFTVTTSARGDIVAFWKEYHSHPRPLVSARAERLLQEAIDVLEQEIHRVRSV